VVAYGNVTEVHLLSYAGGIEFQRFGFFLYRFNIIKPQGIYGVINTGDF
jgi:hypothetical protein